MLAQILKPMLVQKLGKHQRKRSEQGCKGPWNSLDSFWASRWLFLQVFEGWQQQPPSHCAEAVRQVGQEFLGPVVPSRKKDAVAFTPGLQLSA